MTQRYVGRVQILFGVQSPDDPVCFLVREALLAHPQMDAELVINCQCFALGLTDVLNIAPLSMASITRRMKLVSMTKTSQS